MVEESFGPISAITTYDTEAEVLRIGNDRGLSLAM